MKQPLKIKKIIVMISVFILLIIILMLIMALLEKQKQREKINLETESITPTSFEKQIVTDHSTFFSVVECVQKYFNNLSLDIENISATPVKGSKMRSAATIYAENQNVTDEESKKEAIYQLLNAKYINQKHITKDNVLDKIKQNEEVEIIPLKMYQLFGSTQTQYVLQAKIRGLKSEEEKEAYFIIHVDKKNNSFNIMPIEGNQYEKVEDIPLEEEKKEIKQNAHNIYSYRIMQENEIAQKYYTYYKALLEKNPEMAYDFLDEEYRNKRFGSVEGFKDYIDKNQEEIKGYLAQEYEVKDIEDGKEYTCKDQYQHFYTFSVKAVMQFSVKLDNYTIESEQVKHRYQLAKEQRKVEMNVDKWILMLNNRDYRAAYEVLDEDFREEYFETEEKFESYMRNRFPEYYGLNLSDFSQEAGVYVQKILLTDIRAKKAMVLPETIIMKLTEDGFKMSFKLLG